jgi:hypothetical protein
MQENTFASPRKWERQPAAIPISLVLKADRFKADNSAITVDISLHGVGVRTKLALIPGEWVGLVVKREFPHAVPTRVVWAREDQSSHWTFAGLEFLDTPES